ncbi:hypothetical protein [Phenylobacterium sp.]|uniref:hypothetical protein n=1 Tax=Phenylobacterium sp. TaxID=1871053 RepID=UPI0025DA44AE|nr:hypothetical protein [Phenylobacterium sp.]MBX3483874.1 hypothetical protein [Phenylobacterium sp.]MCW5758328.1 hypothetical protein [Phenylobacterium sp.]
MTSPDRIARADRLVPYFEVQLRLAGRMAELTGAPLGEVALGHTNIHRRLGLGVWRDGPPAAGWAPYAEALEAARGLAARVALTREAFVAAPDEVLPHPGQTGFGCFAHDPAGDDGVVRIHFHNFDTDAEGGPLASAKVPRRRAELRALVAGVRARHPQARTIRGGSWLYNLEAYRRLFPPDYVASRIPHPPPIGLRGTATWGQVIDSREAIRPHVRDAVVANLPAMDPQAPWRVFPYRMLSVEAPIESFARFYGA